MHCAAPCSLPDSSPPVPDPANRALRRHRMARRARPLVGPTAAHRRPPPPPARAAGAAADDAAGDPHPGREDGGRAAGARPGGASCRRVATGAEAGAEPPARQQPDAADPRRPAGPAGPRVLQLQGAAGRNAVANFSAASSATSTCSTGWRATTASRCRANCMAASRSRSRARHRQGGPAPAPPPAARTATATTPRRHRRAPPPPPAPPDPAADADPERERKAEITRHSRDARAAEARQDHVACIAAWDRVLEHRSQQRHRQGSNGNAASIWEAVVGTVKEGAG